MLSIKEKIQAIQNNIKTKNVSQKVTVIGVTKFQPLEHVKEGIDCGIRNLGVNYAQDGKELMASLPSHGIEWHYIGHIQSRKVKDLVSYQWVQSLDRIDVAALLDKRLKELNRKLNVLVELNIGEEKQKAGISSNDLDAFLRQMTAFSNLQVRGLMSMPPGLQSIEARRPYFQKLKEIYERFATQHHWDTLSMGTSEDYLLAIEEGSNMVRLGTVLFGERQ